MTVMATVKSYVLVSGPDDPNAVKAHSLVEAHGLEFQNSKTDDVHEVCSLTFAVTSSLEEMESLDECCRELSHVFPEAVITLCEVEERFDQVEHLRCVVFMNGRQGGEIEHGYILNVGR